MRTTLGFCFLAALSCGTNLGEGELGTPRIAGLVRGAPPDVQVLAPIADRGGNIYILAGRPEFPETNTFLMRAGGGLTTGCRLSKGDTRGPMGWVGTAAAVREQPGSTATDSGRLDRAWYWSGAALVRTTSAGDCRRILDRDPATGTDLLFDAVIPWVNDTTSRTTLVALVRAQAEALPFAVQVDLNAQIYTTPRLFEPPNATKVTVIGVGANATQHEGWVLVSYEVDGETRTEARFFNDEGDTTARAAVANAGDPLPAYGIRGYLEGNDQGLVAGLVKDNRVVLFDRGRGRLVNAPNGMTPIGVHRWESALYLVGSNDDAPVVAVIGNDGAIGAPQVWSASQTMLSAFGGSLDATDDRAPPRRTTRISPPRATAVAPFLTAHRSFAYANGTTLVTIAGSTAGEGDSAFTLIAVAPAGITYP